MVLDASAAYPNEHVIESSYLTVIGGFVLLLGVMLLIFFVWFGRGERDDSGKPDLFGSRVSVQEIAARYRTTWSPGTLWPSIQEHQKVVLPTGERTRSWIYTIAWVFLCVWLLWTGIFMIIAGVAENIEVFREEQLLSAAICVAVALFLCGLWIVIFRINSLSRKECEELKQQIANIRCDEQIACDPRGVDPRAPLPDQYDLEHGKSAYMWVGFYMLVIAWALALAATVQTRAWTLPSEQYGMLLFVAPGYGLLTGWLLYAAALNFGSAYCADSCPDGVRAVPEDAGDYAYQGSKWCVLVAIIAAICASSVPDPAQPVPLVLGLLLFTPKYSQNILAILIGLFGIAIGVVHVWSVRS